MKIAQGILFSEYKVYYFKNNEIHVAKCNGYGIEIINIYDSVTYM